MSGVVAGRRVGWARTPAAAVVAVAMLLVAPAAARAETTAHLSPAAYASLVKLSEFDVLVEPNPCDAAPFTGGDAQTATMRRICFASTRWLAATLPLPARKSTRNARADAASVIRQARILDDEYRGLAAQLHGDCQRYIAAHGFAYRDVNAAARHLSRALRRGRPRQPAMDRWDAQMLEALMPITQAPVTTWGDPCRPPETP